MEEGKGGILFEGRGQDGGGIEEIEVEGEELWKRKRSMEADRARNKLRVRH